jgi:hypothetical protein
LTLTDHQKGVVQMGRLPFILSLVLLTALPNIAVELLRGKSCPDVLSSALFAVVFSIVSGVGMLLWKGLPLKTSWEEYRRPVVRGDG